MTPEVMLVQQLGSGVLTIVLLVFMIFRPQLTCLVDLVRSKLTKKPVRRTLEQMYQLDQQERILRQTELNQRFEFFDQEHREMMEQIQALIHQLSEMDDRLNDYEALSEMAHVQSLENQFFNERLSAFKRCRALMKLFAMGRNGKLKELGMQFILNNKEAFNNLVEVLQDYPQQLPMIVKDRKQFTTVLDDINVHIFGGMLRIDNIGTDADAIENSLPRFIG